MWLCFRSSTCPQYRRILARTYFDKASAILDQTRKRRKVVLRSRGEWRGRGGRKNTSSFRPRGRGGRKNTSSFRPHPPHCPLFLRQNGGKSKGKALGTRLVANLLNHKLIPITPKHTENACTAGYLSTYLIAWRFRSREACNRSRG